MKFVKMQGLGNDFIIIENINGSFKGNEVEFAKRICHRKFGVGADGLVIIEKSIIADAKMIIINSDGSRANMCGNAIRCVGKYIYEFMKIKKNKLSIETGDGVKYINLSIDNEKVTLITVNMGKASFDGKDILLNNRENLINEEVIIENKNYTLTSLLVGVPHTILVNDKNEYSIKDGKIIEKSYLFKEGSNVNIVDIIDETSIKVHTWERGAGETLACGTGCCASVVALNKLGLCSDCVDVKTNGGNLKVEIKENIIYMIGIADFICKGEVVY